MGVDLFFIISGYLITKQLVKNVSNGSFKFKDFYFRRFKRIIPALISSSLFTIVIGYYNLSLEHFYELIRGLKYSLLFAGNVYFSQIIDYFSIDTERNLIVNLWSLSVEEQFYIGFPFLVFVGIKLKKIKIRYFFIICFFISLISFSEFFYRELYLSKIFFVKDNYVFYSPFTRTWQFLLGAIASTIKMKKLNSYQIINYLLILIIFLILFTRVNYYNQILISAIGFGLLINETFLPNYTILKPFIHIGNISYSLYLFHQPILAGIRNHNFYATERSFSYVDIDSQLIGSVVLLVIYLISYFNYKYVEQVYRNIRKFSFNQFKFPFIGFIAIICLSFSSNYISVLYTGEFGTNNELIDKYNIKPGTNYVRNVENQLCIDKDALNDACKFGTGSKNLFLLGDSTISSLTTSILSKEILEIYSVTEYTKSGCYPMITICSFGPGTQYFDDVTNIENSIILMGGNFNMNSMDPQNLLETIEIFISKDNEVILLGYIPSPKFDDSMYFKKNNAYLKSGNQAHHKEQLERNISFSKLVNSIFDLNAEQFEFVEVFSIFCGQSTCNYFDKSNFMFTDGSHLSFIGAERIGEESKLKKILSD